MNVLVWSAVGLFAGWLIGKRMPEPKTAPIPATPTDNDRQRRSKRELRSLAE